MTVASSHDPSLASVDNFKEFAVKFPVQKPLNINEDHLRCQLKSSSQVTMIITAYTVVEAVAVGTPRRTGHPLAVIGPTAPKRSVGEK